MSCCGRSVDQFETARDFRAWAFQIARYEVLKDRTKRKRKCLCFSDALVDELALQAPQLCNDQQRSHGRTCAVVLRSLPPGIAKLLSQRYSSLATCESIAKAIGRPVSWVYNALRRIRQELLDCMARHAKTRREP